MRKRTHQPRSQAPAGPTSRSAVGSVILRSSTSGRFVETKDAVPAKFVQVALDKKAYREVSVRRIEVQSVIDKYASAVLEAKRTGRTLSFSIDVAPTIDTGAAQEPASDPLAASRARGRSRAAEILKRDEMLTASEFGELMGISHEAVRTRRRKREVLGLEGAKRGVRFPRWQLVNDEFPLPGLPGLYRLLGDSDWAIYRFLMQQHPELGGRTALAALKAGEVDGVHDTAKAIASGTFA